MSSVSVCIRGVTTPLWRSCAPSELGAGVPFLENVEEAQVVVLFHVALQSRSYLRGAEHAPQFFVVNAIAKVRVEPCVERLSALVESEQGLGGSNHRPELLNQLFSVLGNERAYLFIFGGVLPLGEMCRLDGQLRVAVDHVTEGLLPLMQVDQPVLADVDQVKQILDDSVGGRWYVGQVVNFTA